MEYKVYNQDAQVIGGVVHSFVVAFAQPDLANSILGKFGLSNPEPEKWYSQQDYLNAMKEIEDKVGSTILKNIGTKIVEHAKLERPGDIFTFMENVGKSYNMNHKGDTKSYYKVIEKGDSHILIETNNPYPDVFDQGLFKGFTLLYKDKATVITTKKEGDTRTYKISW